MKYLKKYNESESNEYFSEITKEEFINQSYPVEFNLDELNKISNYLKTLSSESYGYLIKMEEGRFQDKAIIKSYRRFGGGIKTDLLMDIYSDVDEWYYVFLNSQLINHSEDWNVKFIKCDQFEGLMFFLKSLNLKSYV